MSRNPVRGLYSQVACNTTPSRTYTVSVVPAGGHTALAVAEPLT